MEIKDVGLKFTEPFTMRTATNNIVLHHADAVACTVQDVHAWHLANGWIGIAYHFFISKAGEIFKGRDMGAMGAGVYSHNEDTIHICFEGAYDTTDTIMPPAQYNAGITLVNYLCMRTPGVGTVPHNFYGGTTCPGRFFPVNNMINAAKLMLTTPSVPAIPAYKTDGLDGLTAAGLINTPDAWRLKLDEPAPVWLVFTLIDRLRRAGK